MPARNVAVLLDGLRCQPADPLPGGRKLLEVAPQRIVHGRRLACLTATLQRTPPACADCDKFAAGKSTGIPQRCLSDSR